MKFQFVSYIPKADIFYKCVTIPYWSPEKIVMSSWTSLMPSQMFTVYQVYVNLENDPKHTPTCQQSSADWKQNLCFAMILSVIRSLSAVLKAMWVICPSERITIQPSFQQGEACVLPLKVRNSLYKTCSTVWRWQNPNLAEWIQLFAFDIAQQK